MQHIFRHAYLNQELIYDVLLEKEYNFNKKEFEDFAKDYIKLGLVDKGCSFRSLSRDMEVWKKDNKAILNTDKFSMKMIIERLYKQNENRKARRKIHDLYISEEIDEFEYKEKVDELDNINLFTPDLSIRHSNILKYYLNYLKVKNYKKYEKETDTYTLMYLKEQIKQLTAQKDNLDQQINTFQQRVDEMIGEKKSNGK